MRLWLLSLGVSLLAHGAHALTHYLRLDTICGSMACPHRPPSLFAPATRQIDSRDADEIEELLFEHLAAPLPALSGADQRSHDEL